MKDESPDHIGPDRKTVQPAGKPERTNETSKIPPERLTTAGSKVTHTKPAALDDSDAPARRVKKAVRGSGSGTSSREAAADGSASPTAGTSKETWVASGVATGWDGTKDEPRSKSAPDTGGKAGDAKASLFARDDERQRSRSAEESPHRASADDADGRRNGASTGAADETRSGERDGSPRADELDDDDESVSPLRSALEWFVAIGLAILAALFIKTFLLQAFVIPSGSMLPTLQDRDRVLVSKQTYRFVDIERGDVVVFDNPDWQPNEPEQLIKRVIGLPRDSVEAREGDLIVNGKILIEDYLADDTITDDFPRTIVPDDAVFVMGDNRRNSKDSRVVGPINLDDFTGHAFVRIWPPSRLGGL